MLNVSKGYVNDMSLLGCAVNSGNSARALARQQSADIIVKQPDSLHLEIHGLPQVPGKLRARSASRSRIGIIGMCAPTAGIKRMGH